MENVPQFSSSPKKHQLSAQIIESWTFIIIQSNPILSLFRRHQLFLDMEKLSESILNFIISCPLSYVVFKRHQIIQI